MSFRAVITAVVGLSFCGQLLGQPPQATDQAPSKAIIPSVQLSDAEKQFDTIVKTFEKMLYGAGAFSVEVTSRWESQGSGKPAHGTNLYQVAVETGGKFRIEAGSKKAGAAQFLCVSDGEKVTRLYRPTNVYSQHELVSSHNGVQHDAMTLHALSGSGVDLLIRPQFRNELIYQISDVKIVGTETVHGKEVIHLQLKLKDRRTFDLWFTTSDQPILSQLAITTDIPLGGQESFRLTTTSTFDWKIGEPLPKDTFALAIPEGARRVNDLLSALQDGDIAQLIGKPAPTLELQDLNGNTVQLADYRGKQVTVLIFWASWCAPSTNDMTTTLNAFVKEFESNGAVVFAINLSEDLETVKKTVQELKYNGTVLLDPDAKSLQVYPIGSIPVTVLIGKDGTVQAYHAGSGSDVRSRVRQDATELLKGRSLTSGQGH